MPHIDRQCQECGAAFSVHIYHMIRGFGLFCSKECKNRYYGRQQQGESNAVCEYCGNPYHVKPRLLKSTRFCSRECKDNARTAETNQNISKGLERYWETAPEEARVKAALVALNNRSNVAKTGAGGSKAEIYCYEQLQQQVSYEVKWHDRDLVPGAEVDITIPELKVAIEWMGRAHREPIFGKKVFQKRQAADRRKRESILAQGWQYIEIEDPTHDFDPEFVESQIQEIRQKLGN